MHYTSIGFGRIEGESGGMLFNNLFRRNKLSIVNVIDTGKMKGLFQTCFQE